MTEQKTATVSLEKIPKFNDLCELNTALKRGALELVSTKTFYYGSKHGMDHEILAEFPSDATAYFVDKPTISKSRPYYEGTFCDWNVLYFRNNEVQT